MQGLFIIVAVTLMLIWILLIPKFGSIGNAVFNWFSKGVSSQLDENVSKDSKEETESGKKEKEKG